ncbi:TetR/AcrR family transcriptional regulator [Pseudoxanthomonas sp. X-1]|nr:TetR/AcrR family transcriptional regulator [Pseudoxanthomonas sp. X-1]
MSDNALMAPRSSDAALRRRQILDAADEVFCEHGVNAPLELVVERAGLGRATLYRNFPDRVALLMALLDRAFDALERRAHDLADRDDAFGVLLHDAAEHVAVCAPLVDFWRAMARSDAAMSRGERRVPEIFMPLLQRGIAAARYRPDVDEEQLMLVVDMLGSCLRGRDEAERKRLARRSADLLLQALRAPVAAGGGRR